MKPRTHRPTIPLLAALLALQAMAASAAFAKRTFVYAHDRRAGGGVLAFAMARNGNLSPVTGSPFALVDDGGTCGGLCQTMDYSSKRKVLVTGGPNGVTAWQVGKDGALAPVGGSPFGAAGGDFGGTAVVQAGRRVFVYSAAFATSAIHGFELAADGTLAPLPGSPVATAAGPSGIAARGRVLFVANEGALAVSTYVVGSDGGLTAAPGSPVALAGATFIYNVNPDATGKRLYVYDDGDDNGGRIFGFGVDRRSGALAALAGSPVGTFPVGGKTGVAVGRKLLFAFDFDDGSNDIQPFAIARNGSLASTDLVIDSNLGIQAQTIDRRGKRLVIASATRVVTVKVDDKRGSLSPIDSESVSGANANAVLIATR